MKIIVYNPRLNHEYRLFKMFRYSFSEAIRYLSNASKVTLSLSDRYKIFTNDWQKIEICQNVGFSKIDITMTTLKLINA